MIYTFEDFEFDSSRLTLRRAGAIRDVEPVVARVLAVLVRNAGRLVTKGELAEHVWGGRAAADNVITVAMARLRKALRHGPEARELIATVHGLGYRFSCPVTPRDPSEPEGPALIVQGKRPPLVGRASLLAALRQAAAEAQRGRGRACMVIGDPGIGKTQVVSAFSDELLASGAHVAWGFCRESGSTPPLYPWMQLVRRVLETAPDHAWEAQLGPLVAELRALLRGSDAPLASPDLTTSGRDLSLRAPRLSDVGIIARLLIHAAEIAPRVLVLEDLHRADAASLEVLSLLIDRIDRTRILILSTIREPFGSRASAVLNAIVGHRNVERFPLGPLSEDDVVQYFNALFDDRRRELGRAVHAKSRGNPFFMTELARQLLRGEATCPQQLALPDAALDIIRQQVAALDPATSRVLTDAAVIGVRFELSVLIVVSGQEPRAITRALDEAIAARVLVTTPESRATFAFRHELVRAVLYDAIPAPERRRRHLEIALAMERRAETALAAIPASELADHFYAALPETNLEKTVRYCDEAAQEAYASFAHADVARHMRQALSVLALMPAPPLSLRIELLFRLALFTRGSAPDTFVKSIREVVRLAREGRDAAMLVRGARMLHLHPELYALSGAAEALEHALTIIPTDEPALRSIALSALATAAPRAYAARESHACLAEAEALARAASDDESLRIALVCRSFAEGGIDTSVPEALAQLSARPPARAPFLPLFLAMYRTMRALRTGQKAALREAIEDGLARARTSHHPELLWHFKRFRALAKINVGAVQEGLEELRAVHASVEAETLLGAPAFCAFDRAVVLPALGESLTVDDGLRRTLVCQPWDPPGIWALKVRALAGAGLLDEARASLAAVSPSELRDLPVDSQYLGTLGHIARAALILDAPGYAEALDPLLAPFDEQLAGHASLFCEGSVTQLRGMLALARGRTQEARVLLAHGLRTSERAGYVLCAIEARLDLARCIGAMQPAEAEQLAREAGALRDGLGLPRVAPRAPSTSGTIVTMASPAG